MTKPGPGKFQGCKSLKVANALYEISLAGDAEDDYSSEQDGFLALIERNDNDEELDAPAYVTRQDAQGFFSYTPYDSHSAARLEWNAIMDQLSAESVNMRGEVH